MAENRQNQLRQQVADDLGKSAEDVTVHEIREFEQRTKKLKRLQQETQTNQDRLADCTFRPNITASRRAQQPNVVHQAGSNLFDRMYARKDEVRAQQEARDANHLSRENQKEGFDAGARDETLSRIVVDENVARPSTNPINTCLKMLGVNTATHAVDVSIYKGACDD